MRLAVMAGALAVVLVLGAAPARAQGADPPVKLSENGICHPKGGRFYAQTKKFRPFATMEACVAAGGRSAKR